PTREVGIDPLLQRRETELVQPPRSKDDERFVGDVRERRTPPQAQGLAEGFNRFERPIVGDGVTALVDESLEPTEIEVARLHMEHIAASTGGDSFAADRMT